MGKFGQRTEVADICIYSAQYPPHVGGVEQFSSRLATCLAGMGHTITIVTNATDSEPGLFRDGALEVYRLPCAPLLNGRMPLPLFGACRFALLKQLSDRHYDGVLVNTRFYFHSLLGMKMARKQGIAPVVLDHGSAYLTFGNTILDLFVRFYEHAITFIGKRYRPLYCGISHKSTEWLKSFHIQSCGVVRNAIDAESFLSASSDRDFRGELDLSEGTFIVSYAGRLIPEKGILSLLSAVSSLRDKGVPLALIIAGSGPLESEVVAASGVYYLGRLESDDLAAMLSQSDCFCLPSRSEGFATCVMESFACATPVVATKVGGAEDLIVEGQSGHFLQSMSAEDVERGLLWAYDHRSDLDEMGKCCFETVKKKCTWESTASSLLNVMGIPCD